MEIHTQHHSVALGFCNSATQSLPPSDPLSNSGMEAIGEIRRRNLGRLKDRFGTWSSLNLALGRSTRDATLGQLWNRNVDSKTGRPREMGSTLARAIEARLGLQTGWMDTPDAAGLNEVRSAGVDSVREIVRATALPPEDGYIRIEHLSATPTMGLGGVVDEPVHVVRHLDVLERWMREEVGSTDPGRIKVLTAVGRSMHPQIEHRDLVFVDVGHNWIDAPGIYVIDVAGRLLLKKALIQANGTLTLRSENQAEFPDEERYDLKRDADQITVCGKVMAWWTLRKG